VITERRRLALVTVGLGTLSALDRIEVYGVLFTQILEQR
jgi:hypothetical protein